MEHRYSARVSSDMKVLIYKSDLPVAVGWLRNVSRHGLFIISECNDVSVHQFLDIEFLGDRSNGDSHRRCRAMVMHKTEEGFGLSIDEDCPGSRELAAELVGKYRQRPAPVRISFAPVADDSVLYL